MKLSLQKTGGVPAKLPLLLAVWLSLYLLSSCSVESISPWDSNHAPTVEGLDFFPNDSIVAWDTVWVTCNAVDPDSQELSYRWTASNPRWVLTPQDGGRTLQCEVTGQLGSGEVQVSVTDGYSTVSYSAPIWVVEFGSINSPPRITSLTAPRDSVSGGDTLRITCLASDPDGNELEYTWTASGGLFLDPGSSVRWISPVRGGSYRIIVDVSDGVYTARASLNILVSNRADILYEADYSTDQVTGNWEYIGLLHELGDNTGIHSVAWNSQRQAMAVTARSNYGTHSFRLTGRAFSHGTFSVRVLAPTTEFGGIGLLPKFIDERNYFLVSINFFRGSWHVIKCVNGLISYLAEGYSTYSAERFYTLHFNLSGQTASVKIDGDDLWQGAADQVFGGDVPMGVAVYGLSNSGAAIYDDLKVTRP